MQNNDVKFIKTKILSILKIRGPSLPVHIAHETQLSSIFAGALLSELASEKELSISNMKVGGSPLYFLRGQENALENFYTYLPGKEREAFLLLKENKILEDKKQLPAIRVALRNIKDFAFPFLKDNEILWRFHSVSEEQVREILEPKIIEIPKRTEEKIIAKEIKPKTEVKKEIGQKIEEKPKIEIKQVEKKEKPATIEKKEKEEVKARKPRKKREIPKQKQEMLDIGLKKQEQKIKEIKPKEKSEFVLKIIDFLKNQNIEILEERDIKKKEFAGIVRIDSMLGKIKFFCIAKDKKRITENDLRLALQKSQVSKMPALIIYNEEPNKKTLEYAEKWSSLLKLKKIV